MSPSRLLKAAGRVRIGISGWTYKPWRGVFYPAGLSQSRELSFAAAAFASIEINGTFYGLQRPESFARWRADTPDDFVFAVKGSRYITHMLKLRKVRTPLANFLASGLLRLGPKLGPILWQFPPQMKFDAELFEHFLRLLPRDTDRASELARRHDSRVSRVSGRSWLRSDAHRPIRHALEIRHESFRVPGFIEMLRRYDTALVVADAVEWPLLMDLTADFVYCRLHGSEELYVSGYDDAALDRWAVRVRSWARGKDPRNALRMLKASEPRARGRDVFVYFDNDAKVRAPKDARDLSARLNI